MGLPIGALTSQYLGNFHLDEFDRRMKATGLAHRYMRYMDDTVVWGQGNTMPSLRKAAHGALAELKLGMKNGGEWNRCERGIPFLGFVVYPGRIRMGKAGRKRLRRKWRLVERKWREGGIGESELQSRSASLFAHAGLGHDIS